MKNSSVDGLSGKSTRTIIVTIIIVMISMAFTNVEVGSSDTIPWNQYGFTNYYQSIPGISMVENTEGVYSTYDGSYIGDNWEWTYIEQPFDVDLTLELNVTYSFDIVAGSMMGMQQIMFYDNSDRKALVVGMMDAWPDTTGEFRIYGFKSGNVIDKEILAPTSHQLIMNDGLIHVRFSNINHLNNTVDVYVSLDHPTGVLTKSIVGIEIPTKVRLHHQYHSNGYSSEIKFLFKSYIEKEIPSPYVPWAEYGFTNHYQSVSGVSMVENSTDLTSIYDGSYTGDNWEWAYIEKSIDVDLISEIETAYSFDLVSVGMIGVQQLLFYGNDDQLTLIVGMMDAWSGTTGEFRIYGYNNGLEIDKAVTVPTTDELLLNNGVMQVGFSNIDHLNNTIDVHISLDYPNGILTKSIVGIEIPTNVRLHHQYNRNAYSSEIQLAFHYYKETLVNSSTSNTQSTSSIIPTSSRVIISSTSTTSNPASSVSPSPSNSLTSYSPTNTSSENTTVSLSFMKFTIFSAGLGLLILIRKSKK